MVASNYFIPPEGGVVVLIVGAVYARSKSSVDWTAEISSVAVGRKGIDKILV